MLKSSKSSFSVALHFGLARQLFETSRRNEQNWTNIRAPLVPLSLKRPSTDNIDQANFKMFRKKSRFLKKVFRKKIQGKGKTRGKSGFAENRGVVNRGFTVVGDFFHFLIFYKNKTQNLLKSIE